MANPLDPLNDDQVQALAAERVAELEKRQVAKGETIARFARRLGMTYNAYDLAKGRKRFLVSHLMRLSISLKLSMDYVCGLTDQPGPNPPAADEEPSFWDDRPAAP